jgi:hypothetical protein
MKRTGKYSMNKTIFNIVKLFTNITTKLLNTTEEIPKLTSRLMAAPYRVCLCVHPTVFIFYTVLAISWECKQLVLPRNVCIYYIILSLCLTSQAHEIILFILSNCSQIYNRKIELRKYQSSRKCMCLIILDMRLINYRN